jgi:pyrimidine operon attenuation protein/uracil phosphoribosyltransferase
MSNNRTNILTHLEIERKLVRMAWEIYENNHLAKQLILLGISDNGNYLAEAIGKTLSNISKIKLQYGRIDLDKPKGFASEVKLHCDVKLADRTVIMIDDVLNSGRTMLAAMLPVIEQKPIKIQTAVLANRNHKSFPVKADIVGISLATTLQEHIWFERDSKNNMSVYLT